MMKILWQPFGWTKYKFRFSVHSPYWLEYSPCAAAALWNGWTENIATWQIAVGKSSDSLALFKQFMWTHIFVSTCKVEEADHIYLLMKEEYRISRNVRLAWFLGKLNQVIWPASKPELVSWKHDIKQSITYYLHSAKSQPFTSSWTLRMSWICWASYLKDGGQIFPPPCTRIRWCLPLEPPSWPEGTASSSS